jgi:hypothetical protein
MSAEIERRLDALRERVAGAVDALATDETVALAPIQADVDTLCSELAALPQAEAARHLPGLQQLSADLDGLEGMMRSRLSGLSAELQRHGTRQQAVRAYGRGPGGGASGGPDGGAGGGPGGGGR